MRDDVEAADLALETQIAEARAEALAAAAAGGSTPTAGATAEPTASERDAVLTRSLEELGAQISQSRTDVNSQIEAAVSASAASFDEKLAEVRDDVEAADLALENQIEKAKSELGSRMDAAVTAAVALRAESGGGGSAEESGDGAAARTRLYDDVMRRSDGCRAAWMHCSRH